MKSFITFICIVLLVAACGNSTFEKSMKKGKSFLHEGKYNEAIEQFDIAYIEDPSNKDLKLLQDKAREGSYNLELKDRLKSYLIDVAPINEGYSQLKKEFVVTGTITTQPMVEESILQAQALSEQLTDLRRKYSDDINISSVIDSLSHTFERLQRYYSEVNKLFSKDENFNNRIAKIYLRMHLDAYKKYEDDVNDLKEK